MELIYAYIENFKNIENQELSFSPSFKVSYHADALQVIPHLSVFQTILFAPAHVSSIHLVVGKTGSGKSNLLALLGMDSQERKAYISAFQKTRYFFLYHTEEDRYFLEAVRYHFDAEGHLTPTESPDFQCYYCQLTAGKFLHPVNTPSRLPQLYVLNTSASSPAAALHSLSSSQVFPQASASNKNCHNGKHPSVLNGIVRRHCSLSDNPHYIFAHLEKYLQSLKASGETSPVFNKNLYCNIHIKGQETAAAKSPSSSKKCFLENLKAAYCQYLNHMAKNLGVPTQDASQMNSRELKQYYHSITNGSVYSDALRHTFLSLEAYQLTCKYIVSLSDSFFYPNRISWEIGTVSDPKQLDVLYKLMPLLLKWTYNDSPEISDIFRITYDNLSTGEYQFASLLANIEQICQTGDKTNSPLILLIDEPETFLHPELCRQFLSHLFQLCAKLGGESTYQFILTSHSPFLLSDLPSECVTRLSIDNVGKCQILKQDSFQTFGSNIHQLLSDGFFLDNTLGAYSDSLISQMVQTFQTVYQKRLKGDAPSSEELKRYHECKSMIPYIGDPVIRRRLQELSEFVP